MDNLMNLLDGGKNSGGTEFQGGDRDTFIYAMNCAGQIQAFFNQDGYEAIGLYPKPGKEAGVGDSIIHKREGYPFGIEFTQD